MTQLYALTEQYRELASIDDMDDAAVSDTLEGIKGEFEEKANAIAMLTNGLDATVTAIDNEIARLTAMKKAVKNRDASIRDYLKTNMQATGITNIKCELFSITLAKGRDMAVVTDENLLPDEYTKVKTSITPDKALILKDLKSGVEIPGASLTKSDESLRIK